MNIESVIRHLWVVCIISMIVALVTVTYCTWDAHQKCYYSDYEQLFVGR